MQLWSDTIVLEFCAQSIEPTPDVWTRTICHNWSSIKSSQISFRSESTLKICEIEVIGQYHEAKRNRIRKQRKNIIL